MGFGAQGLLFRSSLWEFQGFFRFWLFGGQRVQALLWVRFGLRQRGHVLVEDLPLRDLG